jgi:hypothetical protein
VFNPCCQADFDQAYEALAETQRGQDIDARGVAVSLSHGAVAAALAQYCIDLERESQLSDLTTAVIAGSPRHTAGLAIPDTEGEGEVPPAEAEAVLDQFIRVE